MASFALVDDLLNRGATLAVPEDVAQVILDDAAAHLEGIVGPVAVPPAQSTVTLHIGCGPQWVRVPMAPLVSIDAVTLNGATVTYRRVGDSIRVHGPGELAITATHGYRTAPAELVSWACVIASQVLKALDELGALGAGEVSSFGIDDYRQSYKQVSDRGAFGVPEAVETQLAARYGRGAETTGVLA